MYPTDPIDAMMMHDDKAERIAQQPFEIMDLEDELKNLKQSAIAAVRAKQIWKAMFRSGLKEAKIELPLPLLHLLDTLP